MKLAAISKIRTGKLNSNAAIADGDYPFFTCAQQTYRINNFAFDTDAVLLGGNNANGIYPLKYYSGKFNAYQRTYVFESVDKKVLNIQYLYYALMPALARFQSMSIGAATQYLTKAILDNFTISVPPLSIQDEIVNILSAYDEMLENNRRRIALLEDAARLLYKEWFVRFRFPGHDHVELVNGMPEGWAWTAASNILSVLSGGTPKTTTPQYWDGDIGFFTPKDAVSGCYVSVTEKTITEEGLAKCNSKLYPKDTLFITARGTVGKMNLAMVPMAMNQSCYALVSKTGISQRLLYLTMDASLQQLRSQASGAVFDAIVVSTFDRILVMHPDASVAGAFDELVDPIFDEIGNLDQQNRQLARARDLLLPKLMSGAIAV